MKWLAKTHSAQFELVRHFTRCLFEGEWSSAPGQWRSAAISLVALVLPAGLLLVREGSLDPQYAFRYRLAAAVSGAAGLQSAAIADEVALITLLLCVTGLIALLQWQSLFPSGRDYLALASLPVRSRQVFIARFASVLLFSTAITAAMNVLPSLIAPIEFGGGWRLDREFLSQAAAQAITSSLGCIFVFFAIIALQGVLLNLLPPTLFTRASVLVQGVLSGVFILGGLYSWSIKDWTPNVTARLPQFGAWLPPVWFTALNLELRGAGEVWSPAMAMQARWAAAIAVSVAIGAYVLSYNRYRKLLLESPTRLPAPGLRRWRLLRLLAGRSPQREAVMEFMANTLVRSRPHRLLWLVYLGAAVAVVMNSSLIDGALFVRSSRSWNMALEFVVHFWPLACSVVLLNGFRHLLSIPAELPANWVFRISEGQGRAAWMSGVERFIIAYAIAPVYLVLFPVGVLITGWPIAIRLTVLQLIVSLGMFEAIFYSWQKLPFTCSHIPVERPLALVVGKYFGLLCVVAPILSVITAVASRLTVMFLIYGAVFAGGWLWLRRLRRDGWGEAPLIYEDLPSVVTDLGIKDISFAATEARLR